MSSKASLDGIQMLRGIAASSVVVHHVVDCLQAQADDATPWLEKLIDTDIGGFGVDLFFIISGFIMMYTTAFKPVRPQDFLLRRAVRIYPFFWIFSGIALALHATPWIASLPGDRYTILRSLLLLPTYWPGTDVIRPVTLAQGWTLSYELLFYLFFAMVLPLGNRLRIVITFAFFGVVYGIAQGALTSGIAWFDFLRSPLTFEFAIGVLMGGLFIDKQFRLTARQSNLLLIAGTSLLIGFGLWRAPFDQPRLLAFGLPAALISAAIIFREPNQAPQPQTTIARMLLALGDASYSIYLTHSLILLLFETGYIRLAALRAMPPDFHVMLLSVIAITSGWLAYKLIEEPILFKLKRLMQPAQSAAAAQP